MSRRRTARSQGHWPEHFVSHQGLSHVRMIIIPDPHVMDKKHRIFIKNMVCPRCIMAVETVMEKCGIRYMGVTLGEVTVEEPLTEQQLGMLEEQLQRLGFELLSSKNVTIRL